MAEEKEEVKVPVEGEEPAKVITEGEEPKKNDFEKDSDVVPAGKYNQAVRKQREIELEKRELERKLAEFESRKVEKKEDDDEDKEIFGDDDDEKEKEKAPDHSKIIDEKLRPVLDSLKKRDESDRKVARTAFFESHPKYLKDAEAWQELLDEMGNSINPNSKDDYYTQLEKAHRILAGEYTNVEVDEAKKNMANDASTVGGGAERTIVNEEFTAEDRKYMKDFNISEAGMRAFNKQLAEGKTSVL